MSSSDDSPLSASAWREIDLICDGFEAAWQSGDRPDIAEVLEGARDRQTLLQELLAFAVEQRLAAGESPDTADYAGLDPNIHLLFAEALRRANNSDFTLRSSADGKLTGVSRFREQTAVGKFRLLERLGSGGFGEVWRAEDTELERVVALKLPLFPLASDKERELFLREAKTVAGLQHRGVVRLLEAGSDGPQAYLASDYIAGATLRDWLTSRRLDFRDAAILVQQVAEALEYAHGQCVVHRDVKPTNILIDGAGQPLLADFGLARRLAAEATASVDQRIIGSPGYMSPEQAAGRSSEADARSDVYSLGVVLFELLTGETPFRGDAAIVLERIQHDDPPRPRQLNPAVPRDLETIALACLKKAPDERYQSAGALAEELGRYLRHEPILARPAGVIERGWRWCKRRPAASLSAAVLLAATVVSVTFGLAAQRESLRAHQAEATAVERAAEYQRLAYSVEARYALDRGLLREAYQKITAAMAIEPSWESEHLLARIVAASRQHWALQHRIAGDQVVVRGAFLPAPADGLLVQLEDQRTLALYDLPTSRRLASETLPVEVVRWTPVSSRLAAVIGADHSLRLLTLPELSTADETHLHKATYALAVAPDGDRLAVVHDDGEVVVFSTDDLHQIAARKFPLANNPLYRSAMQASFSPSGRQLVVASGEWTSRPTLWRIAADETVLLPKLQQHAVRFFDETRMIGTYSVSESTDLFDFHIYPAKSEHLPGERKTKYFPGNARGVGQAWLAPATDEAKDEDERFRALVFGEDAVSTIEGWTEAKTAKIEHTALLPHLRGALTALDVSVDGPRFALAAGKTVYVFDRRTTPHLATVGQVSLRTRFWTCAISSSSVFVPTARLSLDNDALLIDSQRLPPVVSPDGHPMEPWGMAVTPDERLLAVLYQENSGGGTISADYFGKIVAIYERAEAPGDLSSGPTYRLRNEFRLAAFDGLPGRFNRGVQLTPDGRQVVFCSFNNRAAIYNAATGGLIAEPKIGNNTAFSADGRYFAHGRFDQRAPVTIVDSATGETVSQTDTSGMVRTMAFDQRSDQLYIGWQGQPIDRLDTILAADGTTVASVVTPLSPFALHPHYDEFVAFRPQSGQIGSSVLAETATGRILEELDRGVHVVGKRGFTAAGNMLVMPDRDEVLVLRAVSPDEAAKALDAPQ